MNASQESFTTNLSNSQLPVTEGVSQFPVVRVKRLSQIAPTLRHLASFRRKESATGPSKAQRLLRHYERMGVRSEHREELNALTLQFGCNRPSRLQLFCILLN